MKFKRILLAEDNLDDIELTLRVLAEYHLARSGSLENGNQWRAAEVSLEHVRDAMPAADELTHQAERRIDVAVAADADEQDVTLGHRYIVFNHAEPRRAPAHGAGRRGCRGRPRSCPA